jgi:hypothetical protein
MDSSSVLVLNLNGGIRDPLLSVQRKGFATTDNSAELIPLVPYDAINCNKVSIRQLSLYFHSLHVSAPGEIYIQLDIFNDYFYYNGSVARTQLGV